MRERDPALVLEIESLLLVYDRHDDFIQTPIAFLPAESPPAFSNQTSIGPYQLLEAIGEGGMGQVWRAEQTSPVRRTVALKLIRAGMDTKEVIRRFESERQTLAIMEHPAIAKVLDAGTTSLGGPFFVMEYVAGIPITTYCDRHLISVVDRLELFIKVCDGIQHAHQKAVLHRDVKPSNILVVEVDGRAVPKIIDFGIARAVSPDRADETCLTRAGALIGTLDYMSPEQAYTDERDIDTRTDVYSLGVVLYELLAGVMPYDFRGVPLAEILRKIREEPPPRPSSRFRILGMESTAAQQRGTSPKKLHARLLGDLDAIVIKALEKKPADRYGSASELAADIARFLRYEPVQARPAGTFYVARKYVWRHRTGVGIAATLLILMTAFAIWQSVEVKRITRERGRADRIAQFMTEMFRVSDPSENRGNQVTAREILDRASGEIEKGLPQDPEMQAKLMQTMGQVYFQLGLYQQAESLFRRSFESHKRLLGDDDPGTVQSMNDLANALSALGAREEVKRLDLQILAIRKRIFGPTHPETLKAMNNLAVDLVKTGQYREAAQLHSAVYKEKLIRLGPEHISTLMSMENLGDTLSYEGRYGEAEKLTRGALEIKRRKLGSDHPETLRGILHLAEILYDEGRYQEAEALDRELLKTRLRVLGPAHPDTLKAMIALANPLENEGSLVEAEGLLRRAIQFQKAKLGPEHPDVLLATNNLAGVLAAEGHYEEAEKLDRHVLEVRSRKLGAEDPGTLHSANRLAFVLMLRGSMEEAAQLATQVRSAQIRTAGLDNPETAMTTYTLACIAAREGRSSDALSRLREAVDHGLKPSAARGIGNDQNLRSLHANHGFELLAAHARERADTLAAESENQVR